MNRKWTNANYEQTSHDMHGSAWNPQDARENPFTPLTKGVLGVV
jgi:hypothetical protein